MNFKDYIKDKSFYLSISVTAIALIGFLLAVFQVNTALMVLVLSILVTLPVNYLLYEYFRRKHFYNELLSNIERLDKAYLVLETLSEPDFLDGRILCNALYAIDKSMTENVRQLELHNEHFKEYIEMWIHEVKLPLSALSLRIHNGGRDEDKKNLKDIRRIENYVEQVLYYARSEHAEKDYRITKTPLSKIIHEAALKYKDDLLENGVALIVDEDVLAEGEGSEGSNVKKSDQAQDNEDRNCAVIEDGEAGNCAVSENRKNSKLVLSETLVNTDLKWITFILGQIVNNSIKYRNNEDSCIRIYASRQRNRTITNTDDRMDLHHKNESCDTKKEQQNISQDEGQEVCLYIEDNGIGIPTEDIGRVFEKSFTGYNGRIRTKSTGMGLYIARELCRRLGHEIRIESVQGEYTRVCITFHEDEFYNIK